MSIDVDSYDNKDIGMKYNTIELCYCFVETSMTGVHLTSVTFCIIAQAMA